MHSMANYEHGICKPQTLLCSLTESSHCSGTSGNAGWSPRVDSEKCGGNSRTSYYCGENAHHTMEVPNVDGLWPGAEHSRGVWGMGIIMQHSRGQATPTAGALLGETPAPGPPCVPASRSVLSNSSWPRQAPLLSTGFSRQEHWSGLPCPSLGDLLT